MKITATAILTWLHISLNIQISLLLITKIQGLANFFTIVVKGTS